MLTRLLEPCLRAGGHARVVNVSSVTHRYGVIGNPAAFLSRSALTVGGHYPVRDLNPCALTRRAGSVDELQATNGYIGM